MGARLARSTWQVLLPTAVAFVALAGSGEAMHVTGTTHADKIVGTQRADRLVGQAGDDTLIGLGGPDVLVGGPGADKLVGGPGADELVGGPGADELVGGPGADVFDCGPGKDVAIADAEDTISPSCEVVRGLTTPALSIGDASAAEGNSGTTTISFAVTLSAPTPLSVSVRFATSDGTAVAPGDYAATSGVLTFAPRERRKEVDVAVAGDTAFEPDETFTVTLSHAVAATIADDTAAGTIVNDDPPPARPGFYTGTISDPEFPGLAEVIYFRASEDGFVDAVLLSFVADCRPEGAYQFAPVQLSARSAIGSDRRFTLDEQGEGTTEIRITGTFDASGTAASGSFQAHVGFTEEGSHYECDTGALTWSAKWKLPLAPATSETVGDDGRLRVVFDDSGQTGRPSVDYELAATQDATWTCSSGQTVDTHAALTGTVSGLVPDTKGHVHGSLELAPPAAPSSCAGETLRDVEYSDVVWTNLTAGVTWGLNGATRTFP